MEKQIYRVKPIVIYPECILNTGKQGNCFDCEKLSNCLSPRSMCVRPYKGHKNGCPNFGKLKTCPPNIPSMYDQVFDVSDVYAIVTRFNLYMHYEKMRLNNPGLAEGQVRNKMYWQPIDIKNNDIAIAEYYNENPEMREYISTRLLECMGVDVINTMKDAGLNLTFEEREYTYRVAFLAKVYQSALEKYGFEIYEETSGDKKGLKSLILKK
jgi:hypothetical protein